MSERPAWAVHLLGAALLISGSVAGNAAAASPTAEFEAPYAITVLPGNEIIEVSGSFSWAVPQNLIATLAQAPQARTIRLDSPGGHIQPALQVAEIIRARGLDTYVPRLCASACTVAFLGGARRFLAPEARLGFHQAHAPGLPPAAFNPLLRAAYQKSGIPAGFIDHVLRTPPDGVWFPSQPELTAAGVTTGPPPPALVRADDAVSRAWWQAMRHIPQAPDAAVVSFAETFSAMLQQLQVAGPDTCWAFLHNMPTDLGTVLESTMLDRMTTAEAQLRDGDEVKAAPDVTMRRLEVGALVRTMRAAGQAAVLEGLRPGSDHSAFCPSMRAVLNAALAQPAFSQAFTLRAIMSGN